MAHEQQEALLHVLSSIFNIVGFRPGQEDAIRATLGGRDSLVVIATGGGKSLIYQLPPLLRPHGFTVVISPLLALARDQVDNALELGIDAEPFNSGVTEPKRSRVVLQASDPESSLKLLYVTPESLTDTRLHAALLEAASNGTLVSFAIDEAHCVSEWGHDFRPAYLSLSNLKDTFPSVPITCLTATCTVQVQHNIQQVLRLRDPIVIKSSFNRPNIAYTVRYKELIGDGGDEAALDDLVAFVRARPNECGIVYARLRKTCDAVAKALECADIDVGVYHAGRDQQCRNRVQTSWVSGDVPIVVATVAFGMGIDKPDVRWVVHYNAPCTVEGFYQESGRGGRDGLPCLSMVMASAADLDEMAKLERGMRAGSVRAVADLLMAPGCRRKKVTGHFGERRGTCDAAAGEQLCDFCRDAPGVAARLRELEQQRSRRARAPAPSSSAPSLVTASSRPVAQLRFQSANVVDQAAPVRPGPSFAIQQLQPATPAAPASTSADTEAATGLAVTAALPKRPRHIVLAADDAMTLPDTPLAPRNDVPMLKPQLSRRRVGSAPPLTLAASHEASTTPQIEQPGSHNADKDGSGAVIPEHATLRAGHGQEQPAPPAPRGGAIHSELLSKAFRTPGLRQPFRPPLAKKNA